MKTWIDRITTALTIAVCALVVLGALALGWARTMGGVQMVAMKTGSMQPLIHPGDLAVLKRVDPATLKAGDVITFNSPNEPAMLVTHRIVGVESSAGGPTFSTKGDGNAGPDPWKVHYASFGWREVGVVRHGAVILEFGHTRTGRLVTATGMFTLVIILLLPLVREDGMEAQEVAA